MNATTRHVQSSDTDRGTHSALAAFGLSSAPSFEVVGAGTASPSLSVRNALGEEIERLAVNEDFVAVLAQDFGRGRFYVGFQGADGISFDFGEVLEAIEASCPELFPEPAPAR